MKNHELQILFQYFREFSNKHKKIYIFFYANLYCYENSSDINIDKLEIYQKRLNIDDFFFRPTNQIVYYGNNDLYSNSTFVVFNGEPIIKYRKSSFASEILASDYMFGFGKMILLKNDEISKKLYNLIDIYICMDITVRSKYPLIRAISLTLDKNDENSEKIDNLLNLIDNSSIEKKKNNNNTK